MLVGFVCKKTEMEVEEEVESYCQVCYENTNIQRGGKLQTVNNNNTQIS